MKGAGSRAVLRFSRSQRVRLGNALISRTELLAEFPEIGRTVPEFRRSDLREIIHGSYRIIYRLGTDQPIVEIVRFWHAARGFPQIPSA